MNKPEKKAMEIARSEFKDREFTTTEMWEKLAPQWVFKMPRGKVFHILEGLEKQGHLTSRKEYMKQWRWSSTGYRYMWKLV